MPRKWSISTKKLFSKSNDVSDSDSVSGRRQRGNATSKTKRQESSSESEDESSSSSSSSYSSSSDEESSKTSASKSVDSSGAKIVKPVKLATIPNFDDSSDGSSSESEFGCGTYRRREDLSSASSNSYSSSASSRSGSDSRSSNSSSDDDESSSASESSEEENSVPSLPAPASRASTARNNVVRRSMSEPALLAGLQKLEKDKKRKSTFGKVFKKTVSMAFGSKKQSDEKLDVLVPTKLDKFNPSTSSMGSRKSAGSSLPSKRDSSDDDSNSGSDDSSQDSSSDSSSDHSSDASSASSKRKKGGKASKEDTKPAVVEKPKPPARRSTISSDGSDSRPIIDTNKPRRRSSVSSSASESEVKPSLAPSLYDDNQVNMIRGRKSSHKTTTAENTDRGTTPAKAPRNPEAVKTAKASWGKLAKAIKTQNEDVDDVFSNVLLQAKKMKEEKRRNPVTSSNDDMNNDSSSNLMSEKANDVFMKVLQQAREKRGAKNRESDKDEADSPNSQRGSSSIQSPFFDEKRGGGDSRFAKMAMAGMKSKSVGESKNGGLSDSDKDLFETPKLVSQRPSMRYLFEGQDEASSEESSDSEADASKGRRRNLSVDESDEESTSEESQEASLSTESSEDEEYIDTGEDKSSEDDAMSAESQMSILTPIAEESVVSPVDFTDNDIESSSSEDSMSASDLENDDESADVQSKEEEMTAMPQASLCDAGFTGGEAMLTEMPDENDTALAKRKAVQNVMKDTSLSAVERNKKIQDIMAGRVELPKVISKPSDPVNATISVPTKTAETEAPMKKNGQARESPSRRRKRKSTKKSEHTNGIAKTNTSPGSKDDKLTHESPHNIAHTSNSTMETFDSSGDEQRDVDASNASHQQFADRSSSLLEIDHNIDVARAEEERAMFQEALSIAESSENKSPDEKALLTATTFALYDLDSHWTINSFDSTKSIPLQATLGARDRIAPWSLHIETNSESRWDAILSHDDVAPTSKRVPPKPSRDLKMSLQSNALSDDCYRSVEASCRSTIDSLDVSKKGPPPKPPKELLTKASFNLKKSAVVEKICLDLLLDLPSEEEEEESDDDVTETIEHSLTTNKIKLQKWFMSILKLDPRWQIRKFFDYASVSFDNAEIFTVWRPTSFDAVAKMMRGEGVGKGLDIKGKSALCGELSGYVPFLQIHDNEHKSCVRVLKSDRTQVFFTSREARNAVGKRLGEKAKEMSLRVTKAMFALAKMEENGADDGSIDEESLIEEIDRYSIDQPEVIRNDKYAPKCYGLEVSCRVLWEELVLPSDISRETGSKYNTGRASLPAFQEMNFASLRKQDPKSAIPVLYQFSDDDPFDPRMLIVAYEEEGRVVPVVSDFDCFLVGSRDFSFKEGMAQNQIDLLDWCVSQIEWILDHQSDGLESWTAKWLEILKYAAQNGFVPKMPPFGFGDPSSYALIEAAVHRSKKTNGAVRHGPECFNYFFPQDLDSELLIIFPGEERWKYVSIFELQSILIEKIRQGFTVPLNPKWILCDPGWIDVFIELLKSRRPSVRASMNMWFPRSSGLRERIIAISKRHPKGFRSAPFCDTNMSLAIQEYERFLVLQRAKQKLRAYFVLRRLHRSCQEKSEHFEKEQRISNLEQIVSARNVAKTLRRMSMSRIEKETVESIRDAVLFEE